MPVQATDPKPTRRRYTARFKSDLVERCLQPGASVSAIALDNGMNANVLFKWRRQHLRDVSVGPRRGATRAMLLPVNLAAMAPPSAPQAVSPHPGIADGVIEIDIGAARIRLHGAVDEVNLRCVLHALAPAA